MPDLEPKLTEATRYTVRRASPAEIVDLRWAVLRPGLPRSEAVFGGDDAATSLHYAALDPDGSVVSCATFHLNAWEGVPAYQLRGMATAGAHRGAGLGRALLRLAEADVLRETPVRRLWCNARTPAVRFYEKLGWRVTSEVFDIPTAGPHVRMTKPL